MGIQDIISRLIPQKIETFIAPITPATRSIYARIDHLPFRFGVEGWPRSWLRLMPDVKRNTATIVADPKVKDWEIESYLELYKPRWTLIVLYRLGDTTWLCYPYNESDARQKGWGEGPLVVNLVRDTIETFDIIVAAGPIYNLVYWRPSEATVQYHILQIGLANLRVLSAGLRREELRSFEIVAGRLIERKRLEAEKEKRQEELTFEGRLKYNLEFLGAELVSWRDSGRDIIVSWRDAEHEYQSRVSSKLGVVTAGICLSGGDRAFNVAALVDVMREARMINRPGAGGDYDDDD